MDYVKDKRLAQKPAAIDSAKAAQHQVRQAIAEAKKDQSHWTGSKQSEAVKKPQTR